MARVVFLLEERSMKELLDGLLPRVFPGLQFLCVSHEGKVDLELSIPRKLRDWRVPGDRFVIVRDNDNGDCRYLKDHLTQICKNSGKSDAIVRIVCQELESWYLGQPDALAEAFGKVELRLIANRPRFRNPDNRPSPSIDLRQLLPEFRKVGDARRMADYLALEGSTSTSYQIFMDTISTLYEPANLE